jgi:hypothetical protein
MINNTYVKTILILAANPTSTSRLRLDEEVREIDEGLRRAKTREEFKLEHKWAVRQRDLYRAILDCQPQIIHFSGHGAGVDGIVLEDETGQPALISADALGSMFKLFATKGVECVLFNACYIKSVCIEIIPPCSPSASRASLRFFNYSDATGFDITHLCKQKQLANT